MERVIIETERGWNRKFIGREWRENREGIERGRGWRGDGGKMERAVSGSAYLHC